MKIIYLIDLLFGKAWAVRAHFLPPTTSAPPRLLDPASGMLDAIGADWHCWRLRGETDRHYSFRLALHLEVLGLAIEADTNRVLAIEKQILRPTE